MGVGRRVFSTFLCDACGREVIAEENQSIDGIYIEVAQIRDGESLGEENVYACSDMCVERAVRDSLKRATLPEESRATATQELWIRGRQFATNPSLPIVDTCDETRVIGTAQEIANYKPNSESGHETLEGSTPTPFRRPTNGDR